MMYHEVMLYEVEKADEVIEFDESKHGKVEFDKNIFANKEDLPQMTLLDKMIACFFNTYALWVWNEEMHRPIHDVAIVISDEQLASVLGESKKLVRESLQKLIECQEIGIILLPDGRYAYHYVL